jgi:hypothetical protein
MDKKKRFRELMDDIEAAQKEFQTVWLSARTVALRANNAKAIPRDTTIRRAFEEERRERRVREDTPEYWEKIWTANGIAYREAASQDKRRYELVGILFESLPFEEFLTGNPKAIDTFLDFCEVDKPAFHVGYMKEWIFRQLRYLPLSERQQQRLRDLSLYYTSLPQYRREAAYLNRVMIKLADKDFVERLRNISQSDNVYVGAKAERLLEKLRPHRKDLVL